MHFFIFLISIIAKNLTSIFLKKNIFILFVVLSWQHAISQNFTDGVLKYTITELTSEKLEAMVGAIGSILE